MVWGFNVSNDVSLVAPVGIEFPRLPLAISPFLRNLASLVGEFVCDEPARFYAAQPTKQMCVKVDLAKSLKDYIII